MRPSVAFAQHRETIRRLVAEHGMSNPRLFGSTLHGDDVDGSDLDILVDCAPQISLFAVVGLQLALQDAVGVPVDLRTADELHRGFREEVVAEATRI